METAIRSVGELGIADRSALEQVVGHALNEDQKLVIHVLGFHSPANGTMNLGHSLPDWCNVYEGLSDERIDEIDRSIVRSHDRRDVVP